MIFLDRAAIFSSDSFSFSELDSESWKSLFLSVSALNVLCLFWSCLDVCCHELTAVDLLNFLKWIANQTAHLTTDAYLQSCMQWVLLQRKQLKDLHQEEQSLSWLDAHLKSYLMSHWLQWSHSHSSSLYVKLDQMSLDPINWLIWWHSVCSEVHKILSADDWESLLIFDLEKVSYLFCSDLIHQKLLIIYTDTCIDSVKSLCIDFLIFKVKIM